MIFAYAYSSVLQYFPSILTLLFAGSLICVLMAPVAILVRKGRQWRAIPSEMISVLSQDSPVVLLRAFGG
jgi:hypothetical protein